MKSSLGYNINDCFSVARDEAEVQSFLNNDVYKFLMLDFILANPEYADVNVKWKMKIRSKDVKTANIIPEEAIREQLDAARDIKGVTQADLSFLRGMQAPGEKPLFKEETLKFLESFRLPEYEIKNDGNGNYELEFEGPWKTSIMWEILGLKIVNTLYLYHYMKKEKVSNVEFNEIITWVLNRLYKDIGLFKENPGVTFSEFGTRRSASTDMQRLVIEILQDKLPNQYMGTSNVMLARETGNANPRGTNAHELRMIPTALQDDPQKIIDTMYDVDRKWGNHFPGLSILLPDTYGTSFYLQNCPKDIIDSHNGMRFDSKDPNVGIPEYVEWLIQNCKNPEDYIGIPSDGLNARVAVDIHKRNSEKLGNITFGIGTNLTNNTKGTWPRAEEPNGPFGSFSVVVKPSEVQRNDGTWVSCVKLSDNPEKAMGSPDRVELFKKIFGKEGFKSQDVSV